MTGRVPGAPSAASVSSPDWCPRLGSGTPQQPEDQGVARRTARPDSQPVRSSYRDTSSSADDARRRVESKARGRARSRFTPPSTTPSAGGSRAPPRQQECVASPHLDARPGPWRHRSPSRTAATAEQFAEDADVRCRHDGAAPSNSAITTTANNDGSECETLYGTTTVT
jgi:hypothetical protein